jgi:hypothetical protein
MTLAAVALLLGSGAGGPAAAGRAAVQAGSLVCSAALFDGDARLGPEDLPDRGEVGKVLRRYQRTGSLTLQQFLATYWDPAANGGRGSFIYPPDNGYAIGPDGLPEMVPIVLFRGQRLDRFGRETGAFLAYEGESYAVRSIPPQNLVGSVPRGCNYHEYGVLRPFGADAGPTAPWFAQPGGGQQVQLVGGLVPGAPSNLSVKWLVDNGYLGRLR